MKKKLLFCIIISICIMSFLRSTQETIEASEKLSMTEGEKAIDFTLKTNTGETLKLSDYQGKVVVLNFWTTWCTYCQEEMEELITFSSEIDSSKVALLGVNITSTEKSQQSVIQFLKGLELPYKNGLDLQGNVSKTYQIIGIPTTFIIDEKGMIRQKILGPVSVEMLKHSISQM